MSRFTARTACALAVTSFLAFPNPASASVEEVLVTAQRREQNIQDVPIALTALSADEMEARQIDEPLDVVNYVPNLFGGNNTGLGTANSYYLRGIGNTESIATFDAPVGTYVDNIYIARQNGNNVSFFDVERIEVLRGPQGTLFGRNTTGGAVSIHMKKPAEEFGGYAEISLGDFDRAMVRGSVDVPISDTLLTKFSAFWLEEDGFVENRTTGDDLNGDEAYGVRADLRFSPSDAITWDVSAEYIDSSSLNVTTSFEGLSVFQRPQDNGINDNSDNDRFSSTGIRASDDSSGTLEELDRGQGLGNSVESWAITSNFGWDTEFGSLEFITGLRGLEQNFIIDFFDGAVPFGGFTIANAGEHDQFTQEIKYSNSFMDDRIDLVGGLYYISDENTTNFSDVFNIGAGLLLADRQINNDNTSTALYAQADFHLNEYVTLTAGVRWTDEEKEFAIRDFKPGIVANNPYNTIIAFPAAPGTELTTANLRAAGIATTLDETITTPRLAIQVQLAENVMAFASYTEGFKSGGWNARGTSVIELLPFDPEHVETVEAGFRSDWFDNTLRLNVTAFRMDVEDFQTPSAFVRPNNTIAFITRNFADMENSGVEVDLSWAPTDVFSMYAAIGLQDVKQIPGEAILAQQADCRATGNGAGQGIVDAQCEIADPTRSPDHSVTVGADLEFPIAAINGYIRGNLNIRRTDALNVGTSGLANGEVDNTQEVNAGVTVGIGERLRIIAECQNCTNELVQNAVLAGTFYYNEPRRYTLRAKYSF